MVETKLGCCFFWLKLDTWPRSAILDWPFIVKRPRQVLLTSFTGDVTSKLIMMTGDEAVSPKARWGCGGRGGVKHGSRLHLGMDILKFLNCPFLLLTTINFNVCHLNLFDKIAENAWVDFY